MTERLRFDVARDGLTATVVVSAGDAVEPDYVTGALQRAGIINGILDAVAEDLQERLVTDATFEDSSGIVIAEGADATEGEDGHFEPSFEPGIQPGHVRDDGTMDFSDRELLKPINKGDVVGTLAKPTDGKDGFRVDGLPVSAKAGKESKVTLGEGVELKDSGDVVSLKDGVIIFTDGRKIDVDTSYVHDKHVDLRSGSLNMEGSLQVRGDVRGVLHVKATGNLEIKGGMDRGSAAAGGDLRVSGGVKGGEHSNLFAEGNMLVHHAERATLQSGGLLRVEAIANCKLVARTIEVSGRMRGGEATCEKSMIIQEAGAPSGTDTRLVAGVMFEGQASDATPPGQPQRGGRPGSRLQGRGRPQPRSRLRSPGSVRSIRSRGDLNAETARKNLERATQKIELEKNAVIHVRGMAYPGVTVQIGSHKAVIDEPMENVRFRLEADEIITERLAG